jgi:hypothetical protein
VHVLSRLFRRLYLAGLQKAFGPGKLGLHGRLEELREPGRWAQRIRELGAKEWVVYAKPPFGGPLQVLKYLARYTHRVAISNARLLAVEDGKVSFLWKDRAGDGRRRCMRLEGVEFVRRFLLHVLPKGFVRIRHFGFLANRARGEKLARVRALIGEPRAAPHQSEDEPSGIPATPQVEAKDRCPRCELGRMQLVERILPRSPSIDDTS